MALTRLDLRNLCRRELQDTGSPSWWLDAQINDDLIAAFGEYSTWFPNPGIGTFTSSANQTAVPLSAGVETVGAVIVDGVTVPQVPDQVTLYEPAFRNQISQTVVQPVTPFGAAATHGQAWAFWSGVVNFRYGLSVGRSITVYYSTNHSLPTDDVTAITPPDADQELIVLWACDRLWQSGKTDAIRRGAPGGWADSRLDDRFAARYQNALNHRRNRVVTRFMQVLQ